MPTGRKLCIRWGLCLMAAVALANAGCLLVVGAAAGGAAGAAGYAYYKDRKDSESTSVIVRSEPALASTPSSGP